MNPRLLVIIVMIIMVGIFRMATASAHSALAGFTPLGALCLFTGFYLRKQWNAYLLPLAALWLSDIVLNRYVYFGEWVFVYNSMAWVYAGFALIVLIGHAFTKLSVTKIVFASLAAAILHSIISNFGVWVAGCTGTAQDIAYSPDLRGLWQCYQMGLPSMLNFLIGNLIFSTVLFGTFELIQRRFPSLSTQRI